MAALLRYSTEHGGAYILLGGSRPNVAHVHLFRHAHAHDATACAVGAVMLRRQRDEHMDAIAARGIGERHVKRRGRPPAQCLLHALFERLAAPLSPEHMREGACVRE